MFDAKQYRYEYEKAKLKRIALDVNRESEYEPLKAYCDARGEAVSGLIRKLIKDELNYPGERIHDILTDEQYTKLCKILHAQNRDFKAFFGSAVQRYIDNHSSEL